jgi:hypothetical protein
MKSNNPAGLAEKRRDRFIRYMMPKPLPLPVSTSPALQTERLLYASAAVVLFTLMAIGFQQFYLHGRAFPANPIFPGLKPLIIAHGMAMTGWMVLFLVQTLLVVNHRWRTHMTLGMIGIGLAACVIVLGTWTALATTRLETDIVRGGLNRRQFMIVPISDMLKFGTLVTIAVWNRSRPEIHRPMMLLATLTTISAATGRTPAIQNLYASTVWAQWFGAFFPKLVIGAAFLLVKSIFTRRFDYWFAGGLAALAVVSFAIWQMASSAVWMRIADFLLG